MISAAQLAQLAAIQERTMRQTATVRIPGAITKNAAAEDVEGPPTVFTMPCRLTTGSNTGGEETAGAYTEAEQRWEMSYPIARSLPATAEITIDGQHFEIITPSEANAYESEHRALLQRCG